MPFLKNLFSAKSPNSLLALKTSPSPSIDIKLLGPRVHLRVATPIDWQNWKDLREQSRAFLTPWEPTWAANGLSYDSFCRNLRRHWREWREGSAYSFLICATDDIKMGETEQQTIAAGTILGGLALTEVQRGIAQKAVLGYWMGEIYAGRGFMTEAARLACDFAFQTLRLNRVEAACIPHNEASKRILEKTGFTLEGKARHYLRINGKWEDHLLWGKTATEHGLNV